MIAYIPCRSGSIRLSDKNIIKFNKKPILVSVIEKLSKLRFIKKICVSTDSDKYADIAKSCGAVTLDLRKKSLCNSKSGFMDLIKNDLPRYCEEFNESRVMFHLATSPLIEQKSYKAAFSKFKISKSNLLMSIGQYEYTPFFSMSKNKSNKLKVLFPEMAIKNTQDLRDLYFDAGCFYMFNLHKVIKYNEIKLINNKEGFLLDYLEYADLDEKKDLEILRVKSNAKKR